MARFFEAVALHLLFKTNVKIIDSSQEVPVELLEGTEIEKKDVSQLCKEAKISLSEFIFPLTH